MRKKLETVLIPRFLGRMASPARSTSAVEERFPPTPTSTSPRRTIMAEAARGQCMALRASSSVTGFPFSWRMAKKVSAFRCSTGGLAWSTTVIPAQLASAPRILRRMANGDCTRTGSASPSRLSRAAAASTRSSMLSGKTTTPGSARQALLQLSRMSMRVIVRLIEGR